MDEANWELVDPGGRVFGLIWRVETWPRRYRCASKLTRASGIEHEDFDVVLRFALDRFAAG